MLFASMYFNAGRVQVKVLLKCKGIKRKVQQNIGDAALREKMAKIQNGLDTAFLVRNEDCVRTTQSLHHFRFKQHLQSLTINFHCKLQQID